MRIGSEKLRYEILVLGIQINDADATALLLAILRWIRALDIAAFGEDEH